MSHPAVITLFPHYRTISTKLSGLPAELVHKILSDIQLSKLLALLCIHPNPYLDQCVSSHLDLQRVLPAQDLPDIKRLFTIYLRIIQRNPQCRRAIKIHLLDTDVQVLYRKYKHATSKQITTAIRAAIFNEFLGRHARLLPVYQEHHDQHHTGIIIPPFHTWSSVSTDDLAYLFNALSTADDGIRQIQQQQLLKLAALIRDHPHMLKTIHDPSQEPRTESHHSHLQTRYELLAAKVRKPWCRSIDSVFMGPMFPLVPYDRYLNLFHKTLNRYPKSAHQYPEQLETVLKGLKCISSRASALPLFGPLPVKETESDSDFATTIKRTLGDDRGGHTFNRIIINRRKPGDLEMNKYRPWPKAEFEWLEAFIVVCGYMSRMQEKWYKSPNRVDTVADFWKKHLVKVV